MYLALLVLVLAGVRWLATRRSPDLVSANWLRQLRQGEREEFHGVSYSGKFNRQRESVNERP
jgi:hypothetical protein